MLVYALFLIGFVFLIKGADFLVDGASAIAKKLRVSDLVIGLTIVAFGTSAPELMVNLFASSRGYADVAIGNVLGSNIANILLILGISALIFPLDVEEDTVWREIPFSLGAALVLALLVNDFFVDTGSLELSQSEGLVLLLFFVLFMLYMFRRAVRQRSEKQDKESVEMDVKKYGVPKALLLLIIGLVGINVGAMWVVEGAVELAEALGVSQAFIGLTVVAVGTSLPELATSVIAAVKKNPDIAVGNVVGSNIFNIFLILGVSATIRPLPFSANMNVDLAVVIMASLLLFVAMFTGRRRNLLERHEGAFFVVVYVGYILFTILRG
ncbi:MAG: calcium/sodium antiporter [Thermoplasmata archaeon]|nr:MAG: calcium/sodium antiporter [Thermoplasmata archaeon]